MFNIHLVLALAVFLRSTLYSRENDSYSNGRAEDYFKWNVAHPQKGLLDQKPRQKVVELSNAVSCRRWSPVGDVYVHLNSN